MHKDKYLFGKRFTNNSYNFSRNIFTSTLRIFLKSYGSFFHFFLKHCTHRVPPGVSICLPMFLVKYRASFDYSSRIKLEILGHVVQSFFRKCMSVHHIHRLLYEYSDYMYESKRLSTKKK